MDQNYDGAIDKKELFDAFKKMFLNQHISQVHPNQFFSPPPNNFPQPNYPHNYNPQYPQQQYPNYYPQQPNYIPHPNYYFQQPNYIPQPNYYSQHRNVNPHQNYYPTTNQPYYNPFERVIHRPNPNHKRA